MSINSFTYNSVSSESLGLYVGGQQTFGSPQRDVTKVSIPGRNGDLVRDNGRFLNAQIAYNVVAMSDFKNKAQSVRNWLMSAIGYKRLEDTYNPEHYRMARVADSVDFETGAFNATGKAKIIFDCMPQRFLKSGETVEDAAEVSHIYAGNPASFESPSAYSMTHASVSLLPQQDTSGGVPSPTNVCPITGYDSATLNVAGKNLLPTQTIVKSGGTYSVGSASTYFFFKAGTYTASNAGTASYMYWRKKGTTDNNVIHDATTTSGTFTLTEDCEIRFWFYTNVADASFTNIQIEVGSSASAYVPYSGSTCPVSFSSAGTVYGGTYDLVTGALRVTMAFVDMGSLSWSYRNSRFDATLSLGAKRLLSNGGIRGLCSIYKKESVNYLPMNDGEVIIGAGYVNANTCSVVVRDSRYTSATAFKTAMDGAQLVYELATPVEYNLTPQTVSTLGGQNYAWAEGTVTVQFLGAHPFVNPTPFDAKPLIRVYGSGTCTVTIGNQTITLSNVSTYIDIDCETMNCYTEGVNQNSNVVLGSQGFPVLPAGTTYVSFGGGTTKVEITPRWWDL